MMDEEHIDKELTDRIREVFDQYEDTTADEGWALLRQRFPEKEKDRGLAWPWYAAAAVVLLCLGVWIFQKPDAPKNLVVKHTQPQLQPGKASEPVRTSDTTQAHPAIIPHQNPANILAQVVHPQTNRSHLNESNSGSDQANKPGNEAVPQNKPAQAPHIAKPQISENVMANNDPPAKTVTGDNGITKPADSAITKSNASVIAANVTKPAPADQTSSAAAMQKLLNETPPIKDPTAAKGNKKAIISVYAATYFNYAKGSDNNINMGAGFSSDLHISNKLRLTTGVAIAQNSLNYKNGSQTIGGRIFTASISPASAALSQVSYTSLTKAGTVAVASSLLPSLNNYTAQLVGLDIPINLKYLFNPQKSDTYVSAGLSSGTFINETYILNYNYANIAQQNTTHSSFSGFDLAKTLNVSFGMGYPLGKTNRLIVEPFLKYPLDGLGSQQIKFGAGGINLKLNFETTKK